MQQYATFLVATSSDDREAVSLVRLSDVRDFTTPAASLAYANPLKLASFWLGSIVWLLLLAILALPPRLLFVIWLIGPVALYGGTWLTQRLGRNYLHTQVKFIADGRIIEVPQVFLDWWHRAFHQLGNHIDQDEAKEEFRVMCQNPPNLKYVREATSYYNACLTSKHDVGTTIYDALSAILRDRIARKEYVPRWNKRR